MSIRFNASVAVLVVLVLVAACGKGESASPSTVATSSPAAIATPPSFAPVPPAATQVGAAETPSLPTSTPASFTSPEAGWIAFASDQDGDFEIWVVGADGTGQRQLTDNDAVDWSPAWSPDGSRIAFVSNRDGNDEVYSMNADGSDVRRLTETSDADESFPAWSPDGKQISFDSDRGGNWDIYVMASDGSGVRRLTDHPGEDWISAWSPDGQRIVFESKRDGNYEIYSMDADGSNPQRLTHNTVHDGDPAWSPDGSRIAFFSRRAGNLEIYTMDPDGSNVLRLTDHPAADTAPSWSPDGAQIVFSSGRDGHEEICTMRADGSNVRQLTDNGAQNWTPAWQPVWRAGQASLPLRYDSLMNGFDFDGPVAEAALTPPEGAAPPMHVFEGRLELLGETDGGQIQVLRGELEPEHAYLPAFDFEFVQSDGYLIPVRRGLIVADHPRWNIHLEPGRAWQEAGDGGFSRASLPFALSVKGGNATFNGTLTFLFNDQRVSKVWYQVTQETTSYTRANLWGLLDAAYHPGPVAGADQIRADFAVERAARLPVKPIQALAEDYPGVDVSAFGRGVTPEHMTWYGVVVNGINYLGGCQTRFGAYPYCESMRATSYSTAKSAFVSVALMRLVQRYGPDVAGLLVKDYVPEYAASPGDWDRVTFNDTIDMATGNYASAGYMADEDGDRMGVFLGAQPYAARIAAAFDWPHAAGPGTRWVYHTGDTFILTRALHNYLQSQQGPEADIFQFVVDEVYRPLGLGPGAYSTMRTADDDWQGQAEGGYGLWWIPDDVAKIATLLNNDGGAIEGVQVLQPDMLAAALQRDPDDRGVKIDTRRMYNNAFWAEEYTRADGFDCEFWVPQMLGVSGNVVALMPNGVTYYYFSDNQEFTWEAAVREADKIAPFCQSSPTTSSHLP